MFKRVSLRVATVVSFLTLNCLPSGLKAMPEKANNGVGLPVAAIKPLKADWKLAAPVKFENLVIFPVTATRWPAAEQFVTLDAALKSGQVKITEMGADPDTPTGAENRQSAGRAEVNQVSLKNDSGKSLLLLAGEMLLGGQQDRIDAMDRIVPASDKSMPLSVFCVERGRWNGAEQFGLTARTERGSVSGRIAGRSADSYSAGGVGSGSGAGTGYGGGSSTSLGDRSSVATPRATTETITVTAPTSVDIVGGIANSKVREKAEVSGDQIQVWAGVSQTLQSARVVTKSGSLKHAYENDKVNKRLNQCNRALRRQMGANVVGVVVAINGRVQLADIFANPSLFHLYWPKLLRSYGLEALSAHHSRRTYARIADARSFLAPIDGQGAAEGEDGVYKLTRRSAQGQTSFELEYTGGPTPMLVHFNRISSKSINES
jgi:hypothetical protein